MNNTHEENYRVIAKYYDDAYASKKDLVDLPFYLDLAQKLGGPVLEIGCGTGRILLPVARAGIPIHGVDNSTAMLSVLKQHLEHEPQEVRTRVSLWEGDLRNFRGKKKYPLVTIPFRAIQHMHTLEDQLAALQTAAIHLEQDGIFAFDVFYPRFELIHSSVGEEILELEWSLPSNPTKKVRRYLRKDSYDKIHQNFRATFFFRTYEGDRLIQEETDTITMSYYSYPHLLALFKLAKLKVVEQFGSFSKSPLDNDADQMIFLLRK